MGLYKEGGFWGRDVFMGKNEFVFDSAGDYETAFAAMSASDAPIQDSGKLFGRPAQYYIKWGFRRIGSISTGVFIEKESIVKQTIK